MEEKRVVDELTEVDDEKKSMSFPIVNGTSMDTELETRSYPIHLLSKSSL
jgi:hypothetical protein